MTDPGECRPEKTTLVVAPVADPCCRRGLPERPVEVRLRQALKVLLRVYGLRCTAIRTPTAEELLRAEDWL